MSGKVKLQVKKDSKKLAKAAAKRLALEPFEILKSAKGQVVGTKEKAMPTSEKTSESETDQALNEKELKAKSKRLLEALEAELEDIKKQKEEEEKLKLQEEIFEEKKKEEEKTQKPLVEPSTRPKRNIFAGVKGKLEKLRRKAEIRLPPSG
jgi:hypothetical protein